LLTWPVGDLRVKGEPRSRLGRGQRPEGSVAILVHDALVDPLDARGEARHDDRQEAVVEASGHLVVADRVTGTVTVSVQLGHELLVPPPQFRQQPSDLVRRGLDAVTLRFVMQPEE
jgi:hypothetical protein